MAQFYKKRKSDRNRFIKKIFVTCEIKCREKEKTDSSWRRREREKG